MTTMRCDAITMCEAFDERIFYLMDTDLNSQTVDDGDPGAFEFP